MERNQQHNNRHQNVKFRYAMESGTRTLDIYVNGTKVLSNEPFTATGSWSTWGEKQFKYL